MGTIIGMEKRGRPPKPPNDRKTASMKIPLTEFEKLAIESAAQATGDKPVTWARRILLEKSAEAAKLQRPKRGNANRIEK